MAIITNKKQALEALKKGAEESVKAHMKPFREKLIKEFEEELVKKIGDLSIDLAEIIKREEIGSSINIQINL